MTPDQLAKSGTEHSTQRALFAWIRWAESYGFEAAWDDESYSGGLERYLYAGPCQDFDMQQKGNSPVPELRWCHSIPNGGLRDKITAAKMKQEGALAGILDIFLPLPVKIKAKEDTQFANLMPTMYAGLYIEMKREGTVKTGKRGNSIIDRATGKTSSVQDEFITYARRMGYAVSVCFTWRDAAKEIERYVLAYRYSQS